jgi:hypothetical protein
MGSVTLSVLKGWADSLHICKDEIKEAEKALRDYDRAVDASDNAELAFGASQASSWALVLAIMACSGPQAAICIGVGAAGLGASLGNQAASGKNSESADRAEEDALGDFCDALEKACDCVLRNTRESRGGPDE